MFCGADKATRHSRSSFRPTWLPLHLANLARAPSTGEPDPFSDVERQPSLLQPAQLGNQRSRRRATEVTWMLGGAQTADRELSGQSLRVQISLSRAYAVRQMHVTTGRQTNSTNLSSILSGVSAMKFVRVSCHRKPILNRDGLTCPSFGWCDP